jgi:hypothetical protein
MFLKQFITNSNINKIVEGKLIKIFTKTEIKFTN